MAEPHDWHPFDEKHEVRQVTEEGKPNLWQIRVIGQTEVMNLTDAEWDRLRSERSE